MRFALSRRAAASASQEGTPSLPQRVQAWYSALPLWTKVTLSFISGIYVFQLVTGAFASSSIVGSLCISSFDVLFHLQVYRILTGTVMHHGLLHVAFNMLAYVPMGCSLERLVGTVQFCYLQLLITILSGALNVVVSYLLDVSRLSRNAMYVCGSGFSGVLFGLVVVDTAQSNAAHQSILGLFNVPAVYYPWVLLLFTQLLFPGASFLGHLSGVVVGQLWVWGYLRPLALPRTAAAWLEQSRMLERLVRLQSFIMMPGAVLPYTTFDTRGGSSSTGGGERGGSGGSGGVRGKLSNLGRVLWPGAGGSGANTTGTGDGGGAGLGHLAGSGAADADVDAGPSGAGSGAFAAGTGHVLGGTGTGAPAVPPSLAAALAAEARAGGGARTASGDGGGGGGDRGGAPGGSLTRGLGDKAPRS